MLFSLVLLIALEMQFKLTMGPKILFETIKIVCVSGWKDRLEFNYDELPIFLHKVLSRLYEDEEETENETPSAP